MKLKPFAAVALAAATLALAGSALAQGAAQAFPSRGITIVIPATPGGAIDLTARVMGPKLTDAWGKPVVVENKAGATGIIGTEFIAKAAPDGYTLVLVASSHAINPSMFKKLPYDTVKSFEPVILTHVLPLMLVVHPSLPVRNVQELIAYGKANPGKLSFASAARAAHRTCPGSCSRAWRGSTCCTSPTRAALPPTPTC